MDRYIDRLIAKESERKRGRERPNRKWSSSYRGIGSFVSA